MIGDEEDLVEARMASIQEQLRRMRVRGFDEAVDAKIAKDRQEGGDHYKGMAIQPIEFILQNEIGYCEANVIKYVSRWHSKGGIEDLEKAKHYIDLLIEHTLGSGD